MSNYYDFQKYSDIKNPISQRIDEVSFLASSTNKEKSETPMDDLIIEDNTIYEIDQECYEKVKKRRLSQRRGSDLR